MKYAMDSPSIKEMIEYFDRLEKDGWRFVSGKFQAPAGREIIYIDYMTILPPKAP
jgi:hypothetical protein